VFGVVGRHGVVRRPGGGQEVGFGHGGERTERAVDARPYDTGRASGF
jgi:hypothetical protein